MSQAHGMQVSRCDVLAELESAPAKLLYLYLDVHGEATLETISEELALPFITICGLLETLESRGHIERTNDTYRIQP